MPREILLRLFARAMEGLVEEKLVQSDPGAGV